MTTVLQMVMPFRRRGSMAIRPVNSLKHIVDTEGALSGAATSATPIATAVITQVDPFNPVNVRVGATINGFFLSVFVIGATGAPLTGAIDWFLWKAHAGQSAPTPSTTGTSEVRNQIIHEEKGLAGSGDGTPMAFKGVVVVPKGMRRMREGDRWELRLRSSDATNDATFCVKSIYKSFF